MQTDTSEMCSWQTSTRKDAHHHSSLGKCKSKPQWGTTAPLSEWLQSDEEDWSPKCWWGWGGTGIVIRSLWKHKNGPLTLENTSAISYEVQHTTLLPVFVLRKYLLEEKRKHTSLQRLAQVSKVVFSFIHCGQKQGNNTKVPSTGEKISKCWYIHTVGYYTV